MPKYKSWISTKAKNLFISGVFLFWIMYMVLAMFSLNATLSIMLRIVSILLFLLCAVCSFCSVYVYNKFSFDTKKGLAKNIIKGVAQKIEIPDGSRCLDLGCKSGELVIACAKKSPNSTFFAVDNLSAKGKKICEKNAIYEDVDEIVTFASGRTDDLDFDDEFFDLVFRNNCINIFKNNKKAELNEALRVLKKGGTLVLHDIVNESTYGNVDQLVSKLNTMGCEVVEITDTAKGIFIPENEAKYLFAKDLKMIVIKKLK